MALPSRLELEEKLKNGGSISTTKRPNRALLEREQIASDKEADRSLTSRFLEELGLNLKALPKEVLQGTARSVGATGATVLSPLTNKARGSNFEFSVPTVDASDSRIGSAIFGDQPFNLRSEGQDFLGAFGASEETKTKYGLGVGFALGVLDFTPAGKAKSSITRAASATANTSDVATIAKNLRVVLNGDEESIQTLASTLKKITDPKETARLIREAGASPTNVKNITELGTTIRSSGVTRERFLADLQKGIASPNSRQGQNALNLTARLQRNGLTPASFFDGVVSKAPLKRSPALDSTARSLLSKNAPAAVRREASALKTRISNLSRGSRAGAAGARKEIKDIQTTLTKHITDNLPVGVRGSQLKKIKNANSKKTLETALAGVNKKISEYNQLKVLQKDLGTRRKKLAYINKINEINSTAVRDMKQQLGIKKPLRQMDKAELDSMVKEAKTRYKFKKERGLAPKKTGGKRPQELTNTQVDEYMEAMGTANSGKVKVAKSITNAKDAMGKMGDLITVPSEALRAIGAGDVLTGLRRMGHNSRKHTRRGEVITSEIIKKLGLNKTIGKPNISPRDFAALDLAMKNGAIKTVMQIAKKYDVEKEFIELRKELDGIFARSNEVGLDVKFRANFFARSFKDDAATRKAATEYFEKEAGDVLEAAYKDFRTKMGRDPFEQEKWKIINNLMRGFKQQGVTLSKTGSLKQRIIEEVSADTAPFYNDSFSALQGYFESANNLIEARRFFGKHLDTDLSKIPAEAEMKDVAGVTIDKLVADGKLKPEASERLRELLQARFTGGGMNSFLQGWKDLSYLTLMGDVLSAVTQIGDFEKVLYKAGLKKGTSAIFRTVFNPTKQEIRLADLGLERTIAAEMNTPSKLSKMVNHVFRQVGLTWIDRLGKESFLNGTLSKYRTAVKGGDEKFLTNARKVLGDEADETFKAIENGEVTENVQFLMLNELADFFPVTLEEVPIQYLKSPNGRLFYTMKTFTTKQLNTYKREIITQAKTDPTQAAKNATRMIGLFVVLNMTADEIKDFIKGEEEPLRDKVVDNMLKVIGFNRYSLDRTQQQGFGRTIVEQILPPTTFVDDATRDFASAFDEDPDPLRSTRNIPVAGELYYWWFGRGAQKREAKQEKEKKSSSSSSRGSSSRSSGRNKESSR